MSQSVMSTSLEVVFDEKKHLTVKKGSVVGEEKGDTGYLVYPMPPVGAMDPTTDSKTLKTIKKEFEEAKSDTDERAGSAKSKRKFARKAGA